MIDLQGLYSGLILFFELAPTESRQQYINGIVQRGIATAEDAALFVDRFTELAAGMGYISTADFTVLMEKRVAVGLEKATKAAHAIFTELLALVEFRIKELTNQLALVTTLVADLEAKLALMPMIRNWLAQQDAGSVAALVAALQAHDTGVQCMQAHAAAFTRKAVEVQEQLDRLGG